MDGDFDLIGFIASYGPWAWVIGGVVLLALELVVPGGVLVWLGAAAIVVGLASLVVPIALPVQWIIFGGLSIVLIVVWMKIFKPRIDSDEGERPLLNQRGKQYVGHTAELVEPILSGYGRVRLGDTLWRVSGPDLSAGSRVKIVGVEGAVLVVEPLA